ncbi:hypothetical protein [Nocardia alni]|uniref:hypothetical protein n=1 Tax=Nocardia alni TaxID=2815723 RepID=UPI001C2205EE|nr:hypothetical protein [Nocardia alni]
MDNETTTDTAEPDFVFALGGAVSAEPPADAMATDDSDLDPAEAKSREFAYDLARELAAGAPPGWTRLDAIFALTATEAATRVFYSLPEQVVEAVPSQVVVNAARVQRESTAGSEGGPWWRLLLGLTGDGEVTVDYDYGDEPFPDEQLLSPEAYRDDIQRYPRARLPIWLAAYVEDDGRQERSADQAAFQALLDLDSGIGSEPAEDEFPPLPGMWARWVTLSAIFVASGSEFGPRIMPSTGWFEGAARSGSTLSLLPGGRAVLSGGLWEAAELDDAYNGAAAMPELYRGAPFWVADQALDPRAAQGLLSFCYWWDGFAWYRGESPSPADFAPALPGIWTAEVVVDLILGQLDDEGGSPQPAEAAAVLLAAAERRAVRRELLEDLFGDNDFDIDGAYYQFFLGGLTAPEK